MFEIRLTKRSFNINQEKLSKDQGVAWVVVRYRTGGKFFLVACLVKNYISGLRSCY